MPHHNYRKNLLFPCLALALCAWLSMACATAAVPTPAPTAAPVVKTQAPLPPTAQTAAPSLSTQAPAPTAAPSSGKIIRFSAHAKEGNLTPWTQSTGYPGYYMTTLIYDTLFWLDPQNVPQPWLADKYQVSADGKTWTVTLHDGVKWQDGQALTSDDVKFTVEYLKKYARPRYTPPLTPITSIDTPDPRTIVFTLKEPSAGFLRQPLADLPILPRHDWEKVTEPDKRTTDLPVGSGPYKLVEYKPDQLWRFQANPNYFKGKPIVDEIVMPLIAAPADTYLALKTGQIDAMSITLSPELIQDFQNTQGVKLVRGPDLRAWYLYMNNGRPPFDQKQVRQAVALAIDTQAIVDTVLLGAGKPGSAGFAHPSLPWYNPAVKPRQDLGKAKALLDGLGYKVGSDGIRDMPDGKKMQFDMLAASNTPQAIRAGELLADWFKQIGIGVRVKPVENTGAVVGPDNPASPVKGDYTIGIHSQASTVQLDPSFFTTLFHSDPKLGTINRSGYHNPQYDALAEEQLRTVDEAKRKDLLFKLQEILADDVPQMTLWFPEGIHPYRPAAFDGWVFYTGVGILNKATFLPK